MSRCKSIHSFWCRRWNWIPLKTNLRYWIDISIHITCFLCGGRRNEKMFAEDQGTHVHCFCRHMFLQSMISLKLEIQMKNHGILIFADEKTFPMWYGRVFDMLCGFHGTCLNLLYVRPYYVQTYVASNMRISQTKKENEKPRNTHFRWRKCIFNDLWKIPLNALCKSYNIFEFCRDVLTSNPSISELLWRSYNCRWAKIGME